MGGFMTTIDAARVLRFVAAGCAAILAAGIASAPARAVASDAPPTEEITMQVVSVAGTGCSAGNVRIIPNSDKTGFRLIYSNAFIVRNSGVTSVNSRKNCQAGVLVHIPQGFTVAVARAEYGGRLNLASGATATNTTNYYFQRSTNNHIVDHDFRGPTGPNQRWHATDTADVVELVYADCGIDTILNINTSLRIASPLGTTSWMSMGFSEADVDTTVQFGWKRCLTT